MPENSFLYDIPFPDPADMRLVRDSGAETPLARVFSAAQCRTQLELARFLGIKQSSVADAKKRGAIPAEWLIKLLRERQVHPDWILTGQGPRLVEIRPPSQCSLGQCSTEDLLVEIVRRVVHKIG